MSADPLWYKDAVIYQLHVKAFHDANDDGIGDFRGLTGKLDYLQELGVTAIWLLPFYPSPLRDDGYDIADYRDVHPSYGTLDDFRDFLEQAHRRDLRVITELVINHTSDQHPWFQRARRAPPGSPEREFYVWSDTPDRYPGVRIIFQDFEDSNWSWDPVAEAYYWHRFYHHQPDLNFDNPAVREAVMEAMDYWFELGVDGLRLDAIPYLYEREGTNCENLPETHEFLKGLRARVDRRFENRMLLAEANQWPEDAVAYFGDGDECHMAFHFPIMPRLYMAVRMEDRFPVLDILDQTPAIPEPCQWAVFLRNHDELTLEMVTDEERDYMYRAYASDARARINLGIRRRLAPLMQNNRRKIELMMALLFSLPGTPVLYYGDEIGMGDNIYLGDRNGVRTPMQWSGDRNAGFSRANPQRLYLPVVTDPEYRYEAVNVEAQRDNASSLLWWVRRIIALRRRHPVFGRGELEPVKADNAKVLAFLRRDEAETLLCVYNLSRFVQVARLEMPELTGHAPLEMFGAARFPPLGAGSYTLTLGPHAFYWFALEPAEEAREERERVGEPGARPPLVVAGAWTEILGERHRARLERALLDYVTSRRWFAGKARGARSATARAVLPLPAAAAGGEPGRELRLVLLEVGFLEGEPHTYLLPLAHLDPEAAETLTEERPDAVICRIESEGRPGVLCDAAYLPEFGRALVRFLGREERAVAGDWELVGWRQRPPSGEADPVGTELVDEEGPDPVPLGAEQSNTSLAVGDRFVVKLLRRVEAGPNPEVEVSRYLTARGFPHSPPTLGGLDLRRGVGGAEERLSLALAQGWVDNEGDAWRYSLDALGRYLERIAASDAPLPEPETSAGALLERSAGEPSDLEADLVGAYLEAARLLGQRTAEMHAALALGQEPAFRPEPFSELYQRSLYQSMRNSAGRVFRLLESAAPGLPGELRSQVERVLGLRGEILRRMHAVTEPVIRAARIRVHGDYHLGQVLYTGRDFVIIDFEGEPARPLGERRLKRSALRDVAAMVRSFHYAAHSALRAVRESGLPGPDETERLETGARLWYAAATSRFLAGYREAARGQAFVPTEPAHVEVLLEALMLDKAVYELGYEINQRPEWLAIPARGVLELLAAPRPAPEGP